MREFLKDSINITNNSIILAIPLIIFILILDLYTAYANPNTLPKVLLALVTILFMFGVFFAGWFYMVKEAIDISKKVFVLDTDRAKAILDLFKTIPEGIGKFALPFIGLCLIFTILIQFVATPIVFFLGIKLIGQLDASTLQNIQEIASDPNITSNANLLLDKVSPEFLVYMGKWSLLLMAVTSIISYLLMLWVPEVIYCTKNPFIALFKSIGKLFKDFTTTIRLFFILWFIGFVLLFLSTFTMLNPITYILMSIIMFYYLVYYVVVIFLYFDRKYVGKDEK